MEWRKVLIVSKTIAWDKYCIGGIDVVSETPVRLLLEQGGGGYQMIPTEIAKEWKIDVGTIFSMKYEVRKARTAPHVEDCFLRKIDPNSREEVPDLLAWLNTNLPKSMVWTGGLGALFEGKLEFNKWRAFIEQAPGPNCSVGFWRPANTLWAQEDEDSGKVSYKFNDAQLELPKYIAYVGAEPHLKKIDAGSLVRVSLARWWDRDGADPDRCYLQISGCYGGGKSSSSPPPPTSSFGFAPFSPAADPDDLPF